MYRSLHENERVAVNWENGWYTGGLCRVKERPITSFMVQYDDGDVIDHTSRTPQRDKTLYCTDEDGDTLTLYRSISPFLGGVGIVIDRNGHLTKLSRPTGAVGSSFDSEVIAAIEAFRHLLSDPPLGGSLIRWFSDSFSCLQALQSAPTTFSDLTRTLWDLMENLMSLGISIEGVWIPSHCGIRLNEEADKLAYKGLRDYSISQHQEVPLSLQQATSIHRNRPKGDLVFLDELPDNIPVPLRRAEVLLRQIMGGCFVNYGVFYGPKDQISDPICKLCRAGAKETVEHIILRYAGRQLSRRKYLGRVSRETPYQFCKMKTNEMLQFLNNEGLLESPGPR